MKATKTHIEGCYLIEYELFEDARGYFFEAFNENKLKDLGINFCIKQANQSLSKYGVLRGLHFQKYPKAQAKLVSCVYGNVLDVAVDLRKESDTFGQYVAVLLDDSGKKSLYIPKGMAHGFLVLSTQAKILYFVDEYYSAQHDAGIVYNDKQININWDIYESNVILSDKDRLLPSLEEVEKIIQ